MTKAEVIEMAEEIGLHLCDTDFEYVDGEWRLAALDPEELVDGFSWMDKLHVREGS